MTSEKVPAPRLKNQDEEYEAKVLDFLDKEVAAAKPYRDPKAQVDEMDLLLSDLLKQAIAESNREQDHVAAVPEERNKLRSSLLYGQEALNPESKDSLSSLSIEFAPTAKVAGSSSDESARLQPAIDILNKKKSIPSKQSSPRSTRAAETDQSRVAPRAAEERSVPLPFSNQTPSITASSIPSNSKIWPKVIAFVCLSAIIGLGLYYFSNNRGDASKKGSIQPVAAAPGSSASDSSVKQPSLHPNSNSEAQKEVEPVPNKVDVEPSSLNSAAVLPVPKPSGLGTVINASNAQTERGASKEQARNAAPNASNNTSQLASPKVDVPEPKDSLNVQVTHYESPAKPDPVTESSIISTPSGPPVPDSGALRGSMQSILSSALTLESKDSIPPASIPSSSRPLDLVPAALISKVDPSYPALAFRTRSSATVVLEIDIDKQGNVVKATPTSGPEVFYSEAVKAVMRWRYKPATLRGASVASKGKVSINFSIRK